METYRSGHNGADSKSVDGLKPSVGSNPTVSANGCPKNHVFMVFGQFFYESVLEKKLKMALLMLRLVEFARQMILKLK